VTLYWRNRFDSTLGELAGFSSEDSHEAGMAHGQSLRTPQAVAVGACIWALSLLTGNKASSTLTYI